MNIAIIIHWLAFAAVFTIAVSVLFFACRGIGATYREWRARREHELWVRNNPPGWRP